MTVSELLTVLFPHLAHLDIDQAHRCGRSVRIRARTRTSQAACPGCGTISGRVHGSYERRLGYTAVSDQETVVHLRVLRFRCSNLDCVKTTFAEQVPGLTIRYGRHSVRLRQVLQTIGLALGGRAGARLACRLATAVSRMTLIRLIRSLPDPQSASAPQVLGVDDFALRRGHAYGTILIDITTSQPIDVLFDRSADSPAAWLREHPGIDIVCRDRAGCYAEGTSRGAPETIQVADRWHLWRSLGEAVERTVIKHRSHLRNLAPLIGQADVPAPSSVTAGPVPGPSADGVRCGLLAERTRRRHSAVHHLLAQGHDLRAIARELDLARNTVRRFARAADPKELLVRNDTGKRPRNVEPFASYL